MADAADSKSAVREGVWVRLPPRALVTHRGAPSSMFMSRASIERRLSHVATELGRLRQELAVMDEQLQHFVDHADRARLDSLISETPLASHEHRDAAKTVASIRRDREAKMKQVTKLESKQDILLDKLLEVKR